MYGSDQSASLEMVGMKNLIDTVKKMSIAYGEEQLGKIINAEIPIAEKLRSHIKFK